MFTQNRPIRKMEVSDLEHISARIAGIKYIQDTMGDNLLKTCLYTTGLLQSDDLHLLQGEELFHAASKAVIEAYAKF